MNNGYSFFLFSQLYNEIHPNETPYDELFDYLQHLYSLYDRSIFNDSDKGEYECMVGFLELRKELIIIPTK